MTAAAPNPSGASASPAGTAPKPSGAVPTVTVTLTLVSHTNIGKTTLARTLLKRDVGEVRDAPHVTQVNEAFDMIRSEGALLRLWDTPGFGDSARLAKRLEQLSNPIGWLLSNVWDRWTNRNFWVSQQVVGNIQRDADVVLYLVNATEEPASSGYVTPELRVLGWVGKPVLVLLNQMGPPRRADEEAAEIQRWRAHLAPHSVVRGVLALDAFARCWIQEDTLLAAVGPLLPLEKRSFFAKLRMAWAAEHLKIFGASMSILTAQIARAAQAKEPANDRDFLGAFVAVGAALGMSKGVQRGLQKNEADAIERLSQKLADDLRGSTNEVIALHHIDGSATLTVLERVQSSVKATHAVSENQATVVGGAVAGALSGLIADLAAGGLTFGGAAIGGAVAGALGARLAAQGVNRARGVQGSMVSWTDEFVIDLTRTTVLRYLTIAHFGRGRGDFVESEFPSHWTPLVDSYIEAHNKLLRDAIIAARERNHLQPLESWLTACCKAILARLYPAQRTDQE